KHPHRLGHTELQRFGIFDFAVPDREPRDRLSALATEQQTSLVVFCERNPRAFRFAVRHAHALDFETGQSVELFGFGGAAMFSGSAFRCLRAQDNGGENNQSQWAKKRVHEYGRSREKTAWSQIAKRNSKL